MNSWVADLVSKQAAAIADRAHAVVVAEDVYRSLDLDALPALTIHPTLRLHAGEWFITDERGDILKINGDRKRIVEVALSMRAMGVIG